jgi:hypothetical protein
MQEIPTSGFINDRMYREQVPLKRRYRLTADISLTHDEVNDLMTYLGDIGAIRVTLQNSKYITQMESLLLDVEEDDHD